MSEVSEEIGEIKRAIDHMQQAHACFVRCFGAEHSEAVDAQEQVERLGGVESEEERGSEGESSEGRESSEGDESSEEG
jgi:hypothetical protein